MFEIDNILYRIWDQLQRRSAKPGWQNMIAPVALMCRIWYLGFSNEK